VVVPDRYVYGSAIDDHILMYADASATSERYYYTNHQGSTVRVADASGTVQLSGADGGSYRRFELR
jgi:hypothetical protein